MIVAPKIRMTSASATLGPLALDKTTSMYIFGIDEAGWLWMCACTLGAGTTVKFGAWNKLPDPGGA